MNEKKIKVGVATKELIRQRTIDIAAGRFKPGKDDPKIWVTSPQAITQILNVKNIELLRLIRETEPDSVTSLAKTSGREQGNLSRTLKSMAQYGLVEMVRENSQVRPISTATSIHFEIELV